MFSHLTQENKLVFKFLFVLNIVFTRKSLGKVTSITHFTQHLMAEIIKFQLNSPRALLLTA